MSDQNRILCTHVGSLARPARLLDFISAIDKHVPVQEDAFPALGQPIPGLSSPRKRGSSKHRICGAASTPSSAGEYWVLRLRGGRHGESP
jgi:hypothetical protein